MLPVEYPLFLVCTQYITSVTNVTPTSLYDRFPHTKTYMHIHTYTKLHTMWCVCLFNQF